MNRKNLLISAVIVVVLAGIFAANKIWFPTIQNVWFQLDERQLSKAPGNLVIFRETSLSSRKGGCQTAWMGNRSGQNQEPMLRYPAAMSRFRKSFPSLTNAARPMW